MRGRPLCTRTHALREGMAELADRKLSNHTLIKHYGAKRYAMSRSDFGGIDLGRESGSDGSVGQRDTAASPVKVARGAVHPIRRVSPNSVMDTDLVTSYTDGDVNLAQEGSDRTSDQHFPVSSSSHPTNAHSGAKTPPGMSPRRSTSQSPSVQSGSPLSSDASAHAPAPVMVSAAATGPAAPAAERRRGALEEYDLEVKVGTGGTATVVRARPKADPSREVALKAVPKRQLTRRAQRYLAREIAIHRAVSAHPHIVDLHDVFEDKVGIFLVLDMCNGGDLYSILKGRSRGVEEIAALIVIEQLLEALTHCHSMAIAHRDIKPENIMFASVPTLDMSGAKDRADAERRVDVRLVDFGLACARDPEQTGKDRMSREKCGTIRYAAPEVFADEPYFPESADMWSVGVVLYTMLVRRNPYTGRTDKDFLNLVRTTELNMSMPEMRRVSEGTKALVRQLLSQDAEKRPTAATALETVRAIIDLTFKNRQAPSGRGHEGHPSATGPSPSSTLKRQKPNPDGHEYPKSPSSSPNHSTHMSPEGTGDDSDNAGYQKDSTLMHFDAQRHQDDADEAPSIYEFSNMQGGSSRDAPPQSTEQTRHWFNVLAWPFPHLGNTTQELASSGKPGRARPASASSGSSDSSSS